MESHFAIVSIFGVVVVSRMDTVCREKVKRQGEAKTRIPKGLSIQQYGKDKCQTVGTWIGVARDYVLARCPMTDPKVWRNAECPFSSEQACS